MRLTKANRQKLLDNNEGFTEHTSYESRNHSYSREYKVEDGKLHIHESGETSWADSDYEKDWIADEDETHRFLYENQYKMNCDE